MNPALPEIEESDVKAARQFLISIKDEEGRRRTPHQGGGPRGPVTVRNGIARARIRSALEPEA
jgi:hypothetical protein